MKEKGGRGGTAEQAKRARLEHAPNLDADDPVDDDDDDDSDDRFVILVVGFWLCMGW